MSRIKIVTDSGVNLAPDLLQEHDITVVPLSFHQNGQLFSEEFHQPATLGAYPHYIQPSVSLFSKVYKKLVDEGTDHILSIHSSSSLLGVVKAARYGKSLSQVPVTIIDSGSVDLGLGHIVQVAAEEVSKGTAFRDILHKLEEIIHSSRTYFFLPNSRLLLKNEGILKRLGLEESVFFSEKILFYIHQGKLRVLLRSRSYRKVEDFVGKLIKKDGLNTPNFVLSTISESQEYQAFFRNNGQTSALQHLARPFLTSLIGEDGICAFVSEKTI